VNIVYSRRCRYGLRTPSIRWRSLLSARDAFAATATPHRGLAPPQLTRTLGRERPRAESMKRHRPHFEHAAVKPRSLAV
jgi:hypothetical protein